MRKSAPFRFGSHKARLPHAEPGQRIGLLGGSFNPPHAAHRSITEIALRRLELDRVWWLVTPGNPLKSRSKLLPLTERMALARALMRDPRVIMTDFEKDLGTSLTAATLAHVRLRYPGVRFVWLMGADCLAEFHHWQHWREIFALVPIAVIDRPGWRHRAVSSIAGRAFCGCRMPENKAQRLAFAPPPAWTLLSDRLLPISSSAIRARTRGATGDSIAINPEWRREQDGSAGGR